MYMHGLILKRHNDCLFTLNFEQKTKKALTSLIEATRLPSLLGCVKNPKPLILSHLGCNTGFDGYFAFGV